MHSKLNSLLALLLCIVLLTGCTAPVAEVSSAPEATASSATPSTVSTATPAPVPTPTPTPEPTPEPAPEPTPVPTLEESFPLRLVFSSGAGAWGTELTLREDFSFEGVYHDSDMGVTGADNPNGTCYICSFSGQFDIVQIDEYSYGLTLTELTSDYEEGKEWIEDGTLHISSVPYGIERGTQFILYLPNVPMEGLSEEFLSWWPGRYRYPGQENWPDTLGYWGLYNVEMGYGFFG